MPPASMVTEPVAQDLALAKGTLARAAPAVITTRAMTTDTTMAGTTAMAMDPTASFGAATPTGVGLPVVGSAVPCTAHPSGGTVGVGEADTPIGAGGPRGIPGTAPQSPPATTRTRPS